ncbi:carboxymuconolactone decarboxylase family protein [Nocardioides immobilis]|uniref:Carboxymuconolactone decarboxylase family protein n=1 Tax=Nocardioides immobilis TaxID=2049295 RepID=A0A417XTN0_9ACTN|nr:carboxymuconolactone decarboxylase family protein [Nocardioides immobilis]
MRSADVAAIAPKFNDLTTEVLFGDVWERPGLVTRDRSLITVAALVTAYRPEQLEGHLRLALDNGLSRDELVEAITHLAFYAGWPSAITALGLLMEIAPRRAEAEPAPAAVCPRAGAPSGC